MWGAQPGEEEAQGHGGVVMGRLEQYPISSPNLAMHSSKATAAASRTPGHTKHRQRGPCPASPWLGLAPAPAAGSRSRTRGTGVTHRAPRPAGPLAARRTACCQAAGPCVLSFN